MATSTADEKRTSFDVAYPKELRDAEWTKLGKRDAGEASTPVPRAGKVGFALSGGGIRSATFCLGLFQGMAKRGRLIGKIDYLSTVSGGGYFGAFLGRLFTRKKAGDEPSNPQWVETILEAGSELKSEERQVSRNLRENGRYLSPNGSGDLLLGGAALFRNWVALHLILGALVLALFLSIQSVRVLAEVLFRPEGPTATVWFFTDPGLLSSRGIWWSPFLLPAAALLALYVAPVAGAYWMVGAPRWLQDRQGSGAWAYVGLLLMGVFAGAYATVAQLGLPELNLLPQAAPLVAGFVVLFAVLVLLFWSRARYAVESMVELTTFNMGRTIVAILPFFVLALWCFATFKYALQEFESTTDPIHHMLAAGAFAGVPLLVTWVTRLVGWPHGKAKSGGARDTRKPILVDAAIRNHLSRELKIALLWTGLILVLGIIDSLGQTLYLVLQDDRVTVTSWIVGIFAGLTGLSGFGRRIAVTFSSGPDRKRPRLSLDIFATIAGLLAVFFLLVIVNMLSHAIAWSNWVPDDIAQAFHGEPNTDPVVQIETRGSAVAAHVVVDAVESQRTPVPSAAPGDDTREWTSFWWVLGCCLALVWMSWVFGRMWPFVNRSSHHPLYSARLTRAYLGASNPARIQADSLLSVTDPVDGDDIALLDYHRCLQAHRGPLHLINVTVNETVDGRSQIQQQDRKGTGMAVGPCGRSLGVRHHVVFEQDMSDCEHTLPGGRAEQTQRMDKAKVFPRESKSYRAFHYKGAGTIADPSETLSLGAWVSISGAAFTTGTGMRTSLGLSLLAGLANVRLGYWWDSGISARDDTRGPLRKIADRLFTVQMCILREFLARFPGTARTHWYLSDGGHFENMGAYELIRRRLPLIVVVDAEADPDYEYVGLANLVRKARLDFGAEIEFLSDEEIDEELSPEVACHVGSLEQLRRGRWKFEGEVSAGCRPRADFDGIDRNGRCLVHAAVAKIRYLDGYGPDGRPNPTYESRLLYIKPSLVGDEPEDILDYHRQNPDFPQETTGDQFFDEGQWESYRRLGQHIAEKIFYPPSTYETEQAKAEPVATGPDAPRKSTLWHPDTLEPPGGNPA